MYKPLGAFVLIVPKATRKRLKNTCFGTHNKSAGKFIAWKTPEDVLGDQVVLDEFIQDVEERLAPVMNIGQFSVSIDCDEPIGWESTAPCADYPDDVLESFELNDHAKALRIRRKRTDLKAPLTRTITLEYELKQDENGGLVPVVLVHSMSPGEDVGDLNGDVTKREGRIFFAWGHPGE